MQYFILPKDVDWITKKPKIVKKIPKYAGFNAVYLYTSRLGTMIWKNIWLPVFFHEEGTSSSQYTQSQLVVQY